MPVDKVKLRFEIFQPAVHELFYDGLNICGGNADGFGKVAYGNRLFICKNQKILSYEVIFDKR